MKLTSSPWNGDREKGAPRPSVGVSCEKKTVLHTRLIRPRTFSANDFHHYNGHFTDYSTVTRPTFRNNRSSLLASACRAVVLVRMPSNGMNRTAQLLVNCINNMSDNFLRGSVKEPSELVQMKSQGYELLARHVVNSLEIIEPGEARHVPKTWASQGGTDYASWLGQQCHKSRREQEKISSPPKSQQEETQGRNCSPCCV